MALKFLENIKVKLVLWELEGIFSDRNTLRKRLALWAVTRAIKLEGVKEMLDKVKEKISGYKTYIIAGAGILAAVGAWAGGAITTEDAVKTIWAAIIAMTTRAAIQKTEDKPA